MLIAGFSIPPSAALTKEGPSNSTFEPCLNETLLLKLPGPLPSPPPIDFSLIKCNLINTLNKSSNKV